MKESVSRGGVKGKEKKQRVACGIRLGSAGNASPSTPSASLAGH